MFSIICDIKKQVGAFGPGKDMYSYYNCIPILSEKGNLVFYSSNVTTMNDVEPLLEKNVVGGLAPFGYEDTYDKLSKINDITSIKYLTLMEKNEKGMLEAGGNKYTMFSERLVNKESGKPLFNKINLFFNDDFIDSNLKRKADNGYHLPEQYLEKVMQKSLYSYIKVIADGTPEQYLEKIMQKSPNSHKEVVVDETPMDTQATVVPDQRTELNSEEQLLTWGQYITDSVYSLYDTVVNFMYGDSAQQEL